MTTTSYVEILTGKEIRSVAAALMRATPDQPARWVDDDEILRAVRFFESARKRLALLELVVSGTIVMRWSAEIGDWRLWHVDDPAFGSRSEEPMGRSAS